MKRRDGFTLIEVLLALVLLAALFLALNQFLFTLLEAWSKDRDRFIFAQHTRAVSEHLDAMFRTSVASASASRTNFGAPIGAELQVPDAGRRVLLTFDLPEGDRLLTWPGAPLPEVQCALALQRDEGLVLLYKSRLEEDFANAEMRTVVVSPFVTELTYDYYEETTKSWRRESELRQSEGAYVTPRRIALRFRRGKQEYVEYITVPATREGLPAY